MKYIALALIVGLASLLPFTSAQAVTTYIWDADTGTAGNQYGSGTWNSSSANWTTTIGGTDLDWVSGSTSAMGIGGSGYTNTGGGTITLGENITLNSLSMSSSVSGAFTISGGGFTLTLSGTNPILSNNYMYGALTIDAVITGSNGLTKSNAGTVILSQNGTWTGGTNVTGLSTFGGMLQVGNGGTTGVLGSGTVTISTATGQTAASTLSFKRSDAITVSNAVTFANATVGGIVANAGSNELTLSGTQTLTGPATYQIASTSSTSVDAEISGAITGAGTLTKTGAGSLLLSNAGNNYTGGTVVSAGKLVMGSSAALGSSTASITVGGGATLDLGGYSAQVAALNSSGATAAFVSNVSSTVATLGVTSLNLAGTGTVGALTVGGGSSTATTTLNLSGATLNFDISSNSSFDALTLGGDGALTLSGTTLDLNFIGTSLTAGTLKLIAATNSSQITSLTDLTLGTTTINGLNASLALDASGNVDLVLTATPEPATWALGAMGIVTAVVGMRFRDARPLLRKS